MLAVGFSMDVLLLRGGLAGESFVSFGPCIPVMQSAQYQGLLFQLDLDFFLSVHFL